MSGKKELQRVKARVHDLLLRSPKTRDNDGQLIAAFWYNELIDMGVNPHKISAFDLMNIISKRKLASTASIIRERRILQKEDPRTRGALYDKRRKDYQVDTVRNIYGT